MRFETSQTTPSFLDRRLQRRMLSFVGLIAIIMVTLGVMNNRPAADRRTGVSPDSLTYEVHREERALKPDEVIIGGLPEDNEPRGQWGATNSRDRSRDDVANDDQGLFKSRKQERSQGDRFFPRRSTTPANADVPFAGEPVRAKNNPAFDDDRFDEPRTATRPDRGPSVVSSPPEEDRNPFSDSPVRSRIEDLDDQIAEPVRRPPSSFDDQTPRVGDFNPKIDDLEPFRSNHAENDPMDSPRDLRTSDDDVNLDAAPRGRHSRKTTVGNNLPPARRPLDEAPLTDPLDQPRRGDRRQTPQSDTEPFREDFASVQIDKRYLDLVKDNTLGIRKDESETFYWLLDHARRASSRALERSGLTEVQYVNLMTEPDRFRGDPITIEGDLWRLYEIDASPNDYGVSRIYEGWVFTGDSGNHPYRIVCTSLAKGIEPGENLRKPVRLTGYFFKREGYRSNGGVHVAPTLLAHRIGINPMPNGIPLTAGVVPYMIGAIMAVGLALLVTVVGFAIGDERSARAGSRRLRHPPQVSFAGLPVPTLVSVEESLRQFAERQREAAISGAYGPLLTRQTAREHAVHDESTSHQVMIDEERRQHQRQTGALQDWASRQQAAQAEIEALRTGNETQSATTANVDELLDSNKLDPARNVLPKSNSPEQPIVTRATFTPAVVIHVPPAIVPPPVPAEMFAAISSVAPNPHPVVSQLHSVVTTSPTHTTSPLHTVPPSSSISYGASKLSEWEAEVAKMNNRANIRGATNPLGTSSVGTTMGAGLQTTTPLAQIERDRLAREQEIRDRIRRQQAETERLRLEQLERDRIEHERQERERHQHEQRERDRIAAERALSEHHDNHGTTFTLSQSAADRLELERLELERLEHERYQHERLIQERAAAANRVDQAHSSHSQTSSNLSERFDHERLERERLERDRLEHDHRERMIHDRERETLELERLERERIEHEQTPTHREYDRHLETTPSSSTTDVDSDSYSESNYESDGPNADESTGDSTNRATQTTWGRNRKRRRNLRDGRSN